MTDSEILKTNLVQFGLSADAVDYLMGMWTTAQFFDDVWDGDYSDDPASLDGVLWWCLVGMACNPFYARHSAALIPIHGLVIAKWHGANAIEDAGQADARSYMWRAGFYDLVMTVAILDLGHAAASEAAHVVAAMYGESLSDYLEEF